MPAQTHACSIIIISVSTAGTKEERTDYKDPITIPNEAYGMHSASSVTKSHAQQTSSAVPRPTIEKTQMYEPIDK